MNQLLDLLQEVVSSSEVDTDNDTRDAEWSADCEEVAAEMDGFIGALWEDRADITERAQDNLGLGLELLDFAILHSCDASLFAAEHQDDGRSPFWPDDAEDVRPTPRVVFTTLTASVAQHLQAVRHLAVYGFEGILRSVGRSYLEVADTLLAATLDEEFLRRYREVYENPVQQFNHWKRYLAPAKLRTILKNNDAPGWGGRGWQVSDLREDTYRWFSGFSHVNLIAHAVSTAGSFFLGRTSEMSDAAVATLLLYHRFFIEAFDRELRSQHRWNEYDAEEDRDWYFRRSYLLQAAITTWYNDREVAPPPKLGG